jgi:hypothetical protein
VEAERQAIKSTVVGARATGARSSRRVERGRLVADAPGCNWQDGVQSYEETSMSQTKPRVSSLRPVSLHAQFVLTVVILAATVVVGVLYLLR